MALALSPEVSVISPVYNSEKFIMRLVETVQRQVGCTIEHIVVDDCSTDNSYKLLEEFARKYSNLRLVRLPRNSGPVIARNQALKLARGKYLAFLDADDYWLPDKTRIQIDFMQKHQCHLTFSDYRFISEDGTLVGSPIVGADRIGYYRHLATRSGLGCLTVMIDSDKVSNFQFSETNPVTTRAEDFYAWLQIIKNNGSAIRVPHDLARYSVVQNSRSSKVMYKASVIWKIYWEVLKLGVIRSAFFFSCFAVSAAFKRKSSLPTIPIEKVDGRQGEEWLALVRLRSEK